MKTEHSLYKDKIKLVFDSVKHTYKVDDKIVYGVTGIIGIINKPALVNWATNLAVNKVRERKDYLEKHLEDVLKEAKGEHYKVSKEAKELGTRVHNVADRWFSEDKFGLVQEMLLVKREEERNALSVMLEFLKTSKPDRKFGEKKIYSKKYSYAGTVDFIGLLNGVMTVADYKTSSAIYPDYFLQTSAYAQAIEEELGIKVKQTAVIRFGKDRKLEIQTDKKWKEKLPVFLALKNIYEWQMNIIGRSFESDIKASETKTIKKQLDK